MEKVLLAISKGTDGEARQVYYGGLPWYGVKVATLEQLKSEEVKIDNLRVSDKDEVICTRGDIRKYTTMVGSKVQNKSYVVLGVAQYNEEDIYFVTDGLSDPMWIKQVDLNDTIVKNKINLANSKLEWGENGSKLVSTEDEFKQIDYTKIQIEYRKYLKSHKS